MSNIYLDGTIISIHVHKWEGKSTLKAADLGLTEEEVSKGFNLGHKDLIPKEIILGFNRIDNRARGILKINAFSYPEESFFFLPKTRYEHTFAALEQCKAEYDALAESLIANLPQYKEEMRATYRQAAEIAYMKQLPSGVTEFNLTDHEAEKETYIQEYLARIERYYPSEAEIRRKFRIVWNVGFNLAIDVSEGNINSNDLVRRAQQEEARHEAEVQAQVTDTVKKSADIEEYKRQTAERMGGFVDSVVKSLREQTVKLCNDVAQNIKDGMVITGRTTNRLKEFIDRFKDLNFVGDQVVEEQLNSFRREFLDVFPADQLRDDPELQVELGRRLAYISNLATNMTDVSEVAGEYTRRLAYRRAPAKAQDEPSVEAAAA